MNKGEFNVLVLYEYYYYYLLKREVTQTVSGLADQPLVKHTKIREYFVLEDRTYIQIYFDP